MADTNAGSIYYDVKIDTKGLNSAGTAVKNFAKGATVALTAASAAAVAFGVSAFKAYEDAEKAEKQLRQAVINATGATEEQLKATSDLADELERKGVLDGDNIKVGLAQLSTFGLSNEAVQKLAGSLSDLAVNQSGVSATSDDLTNSANMIAKALRGEFGILQKSGIRFTEAQIATIKYGTELEKVAAINEGFAQNLKYTNEVAKTTSEGGLAKLKVNIENVQEAIGGAIAQGINPLIKKLSEFVQSDQFSDWVQDVTNWLTTNLPIALNYVTEKLLPLLRKIFDDIWPVIQKVYDILSNLVTYISNNTWVIVALASAFALVKTAMFLSGAQAAFEGVMAAAGGSYKGLALLMASPIVLSVSVGAALAAIALVYDAAQKALAAVDRMNQAVTGQTETQSQASALYQKQLKEEPAGSAKSINAKANLLFPKASDNAVKQAYIALMNRADLDQSTKDARAKALTHGYSNGGFTGIGGSNEVAGVVHRGEFVVPKNMVDQSTGTPKMGGIENHIGTINISSEVDGEKWLQRLTQNQEIISKGLVPTQRYA